MPSNDRVPDGTGSTALDRRTRVGPTDRAAEGRAAATPEDLQRIDVLHVDDHGDLLELSRAFLSGEDERISVTTETRATDGLDRIDEVDVVVSDFQMPEMDGLEFLEAVRQRRPELPFIIFTGKGREEVAVEALNLGADRYLQKGGDPSSQYGLLADAIVQETTHSRARDRFKESEERYRSLVDALPDIVFLTDYDSRMLWANSALERRTGLTVEDFQVPQEENPFIHPEDAERVAERLESFVESDRKYSDPIDNRFIDPEGNVHGYSSIVAKISYEGDPALQFVTREVTERRKREERLRTSLRRYRALAESIPDGMVALFDADLRYTDVAGEVVEAVAATETDYADTPVDELAPDAPFGAERATYEAVFDGEERVFTFERAGGTYERRLVPVRDGDEVTAGLELTIGT